MTVFAMACARMGVLALLLPGLALSSAGQSHASHPKEKLPKVGSAPAILWREPTDIKTRDLYYGPGGKDHVPRGKLSFVDEDLHGTNPKFNVLDEDHVHWGVKMGNEAGPETAATRLVWAAGYFADEEYYVPELPAKGLPRLSRGENLIHKGTIHGARLKRHNHGEQHIGFWRFDKNPFAGTRELNGLKVVMELINNTDFKPEHLVIFDVDQVEQRYMIKDLGASFGRAGAGYFNRTKGVLSDYLRFPLIKKADPGYLDFWYFKHIPRADAKWIGGILAQLSDEQIADAFRAGGFSPEEVEGFTKKLREKIIELNNL